MRIINFFALIASSVTSTVLHDFLLTREEELLSLPVESLLAANDEEPISLFHEWTDARRVLWFSGAKYPEDVMHQIATLLSESEDKEACVEIFNFMNRRPNWFVLDKRSAILLRECVRTVVYKISNSESAVAKFAIRVMNLIFSPVVERVIRGPLAGQLATPTEEFVHFKQFLTNFFEGESLLGHEILSAIENVTIEDMRPYLPESEFDFIERVIQPRHDAYPHFHEFIEISDTLYYRFLEKNAPRAALFLFKIIFEEFIWYDIEDSSIPDNRVILDPYYYWRFRAHIATNSGVNANMFSWLGSMGGLIYSLWELNENLPENRNRFIDCLPLNFLNYPDLMQAGNITHPQDMNALYHMMHGSNNFVILDSYRCFANGILTNQFILPRSDSNNFDIFAARFLHLVRIISNSATALLLTIEH